MATTEKYCTECSDKFKLLPVSEQTQKEREFLNASELTPGPNPDYDNSVRSGEGQCYKCHKQGIVDWYPL